MLSPRHTHGLEAELQPSSAMTCVLPVSDTAHVRQPLKHGSCWVGWERRLDGFGNSVAHSFPHMRFCLSRVSWCLAAMQHILAQRRHWERAP